MWSVFAKFDFHVAYFGMNVLSGRFFCFFVCFGFRLAFVLRACSCSLRCVGPWGRSFARLRFLEFSEVHLVCRGLGSDTWYTLFYVSNHFIPVMPSGGTSAGILYGLGLGLVGHGRRKKHYCTTPGLGVVCRSCPRPVTADVCCAGGCCCCSFFFVLA